MSKFGLLGGRLGHSFSVDIHNEYYNIICEKSTYELIEIPESDDVEDFIKSLSEKGFSGINVTIPYKTLVMDYLDYISEEAKKIGAVNTITVENGRLKGYNTDYFGFGEMLDKYDVDVKNKNVYVLGTGGASKAISALCEDRGAKVIFVSRKPSYNAISYEELKSDNGGILVNCTPVGMYPDIDSSPVDNVDNFDAVVDIVYNPPKTKLMKLAHDCGIKNVNGLYMLVSQAVCAENIWHGVDSEPDITEKIFHKLYSAE